MRRYHNVVIDSAGNPVNGATVTVKIAGTSNNASLFSDEGITSLANPVTTDSLGRFAFYVADGDYDLAIVKSGVINITVTDVTIADPKGLTPLVLPKKLVVGNNSATPDSKVDVSADEIVVEDSSGARKILKTVSVSADIAVAGANGLDTGAEAASTWYNIWVIHNPTAGTTAGLLSLSSTAPTMPSGFTYKRRVGAVRNDGSSNFLRFELRDSVTLYTEVEIETRALNAGQATTLTDVSLTSFVPPTSRRVFLHVYVAVNHNAAGTNFDTHILQKGAPGTTDGIIAVAHRAQSSGTVHAAANTLWVGTNASQVVQYKINNVPATSGGVTLYVAGYEDPI